MKRIPGLRRLFRLGGGHDVESAVDDELAFHLETTVQELVASGMPEAEARREAAWRFGDVVGTRERLVALDRLRVNAERRAAWWSALEQDERNRPGKTAAVVSPRWRRRST